MTLQEKIEFVRRQFSGGTLANTMREIAAEVSQLQTANSVILGHVHALESAVRAYCPVYAVMSKEDDQKDKRIAELEARCRQTAQTLIGCIGASGPMNCEEAAVEAAERIAELEAAMRGAINSGHKTRVRITDALTAVPPPEPEVCDE